MDNDNESEWVSVAQAQKMLGVSKAKMSQLLRDGKLHAEEDAYDKRFKLLRRADVEAFARLPRLPKNAA